MAPAGQRKVAFSAKQKKEQLKERKERKKNEIRDEYGVVDHRAMKKQQKERERKALENDEGDLSVRKINHQPKNSTRTSNRYDPNRYMLHFKSDTGEEVEKGKALAREPIHSLPEEACEIDLDQIYKPGTALDMPKRPQWSHQLTKEQLNSNEESYFKRYLDKIFQQFDGNEMSYFELNLETWRQLWRVLEMSDVILLITDIRHPALHFSPALYDHVVNDLKKHIILVLNKIDLAPPPLVLAWKEYFQKRFPSVSIVCFTSMAKVESDLDRGDDPSEVIFKKRMRKFNAIGPKQLLQVCERIVRDKVDLSSWKKKIEYDFDEICIGKEEEEEEDEDDNDGDDDDAEEKALIDDEENKDDDFEGNAAENFEKRQFCQDKVLTIGCCGYPNVGKSSLINGLMGKKVVSVSKTPGHTKHFQTIFLTKSVKLCDSPGLVFPSLVERPLQILSGIFPIAQVREPYSVVRYLAERLPLTSLLKLSKSEGIETGEAWTAFTICDSWAEQRGFLTAKAARPDAYRAANHLLRLAVEGRLCLCMRPPSYTKDKHLWSTHPELESLKNSLAF